MTTPIPPFDVTAAPRAVLRESVRLLYRFLGEERLGTARANAWANGWLSAVSKRLRVSVTVCDDGDLFPADTEGMKRRSGLGGHGRI